MSLEVVHLQILRAEPQNPFRNHEAYSISLQTSLEKQYLATFKAAEGSYDACYCEQLVSGLRSQDRLFLAEARDKAWKDSCIHLDRFSPVTWSRACEAKHRRSMALTPSL